MVFFSGNAFHASTRSIFSPVDARLTLQPRSTFRNTNNGGEIQEKQVAAHSCTGPAHSDGTDHYLGSQAMINAFGEARKNHLFFLYLNEKKKKGISRCVIIIYSMLRKLERVGSVDIGYVSL